jgi:hypothetical protein
MHETLIQPPKLQSHEIIEHAVTGHLQGDAEARKWPLERYMGVEQRQLWRVASPLAQCNPMGSLGTNALFAHSLRLSAPFEWIWDPRAGRHMHS